MRCVDRVSCLAMNQMAKMGEVSFNHPVIQYRATLQETQILKFSFCEEKQETLQMCICREVHRFFFAVLGYKVSIVAWRASESF